MALITTLIPAQNYETVRDAIAAILTVELANQYTLSGNTYPNIQGVWIERVVPFDTEVELPAVNVWVDHAMWEGKTLVKTDGYVTYNIDIHNFSPSPNDSGIPGNQLAAMQMQKIAGLIRAILSNENYITLGFAQGVIGFVAIKNLAYVERGNYDNQDALSDVCGRIQVQVFMVETANGSVPTGVPLQKVQAIVTMVDTDYGFKIQLITT